MDFKSKKVKIHQVDISWQLNLDERNLYLYTDNSKGEKLPIRSYYIVADETFPELH